MTRVAPVSCARGDAPPGAAIGVRPRLFTAGCSSALYPASRGPSSSRVVMESGSLAYVRDGKTYEGGLFGGEIEEADSGNPRAEEYARDIQRPGATTGFALSMLGLGGHDRRRAVGAAEREPSRSQVPSTGLVMIGAGRGPRPVGSFVHDRPRAAPVRRGERLQRRPRPFGRVASPATGRRNATVPPSSGRNRRPGEHPPRVPFDDDAARLPELGILVVSVARPLRRPAARSSQPARRARRPPTRGRRRRSRTRRRVTMPVPSTTHAAPARATGAPVDAAAAASTEREPGRRRSRLLDRSRDLLRRQPLRGRGRPALRGLRERHDRHSRSGRVAGTTPVVDTMQHARGTHALHITQNGQRPLVHQGDEDLPGGEQHVLRADVRLLQVAAVHDGRRRHDLRALDDGRRRAGRACPARSAERAAAERPEPLGRRDRQPDGQRNRRLDDSATTTRKGNPTAVPQNQWLCIEWMHKGDTNETQFWWDGTLHPSLSTTASMHGGNTNPFLLPQFTQGLGRLAGVPDEQRALRDVDRRDRDRRSAHRVRPLTFGHWKIPLSSKK